VDHCLITWPHQWAESVGPIRRCHYHDSRRFRPLRVAAIFQPTRALARRGEAIHDCFPDTNTGLPGRAGITLCFASPASTLSIEKLREVPERFLFIFLFIGLGEEPGWRGFALPQLQTRYSPLIASLILGSVWALWHLPLVGNEFPSPIVPAFLLSLFGATFMLTWLFNRTNDSVFLPMLFHATVNTIGAGLIFPLFSGAALTILWYIYGVIWLCAGLAMLLVSGNKRS